MSQQPKTDVHPYPLKRRAERGEPVRPVTVIIALAVTGLIIYAGHINGFIGNTSLGGLHFPIGPFLVLLVFVLGVNVLLRMFLPRRAFSTAQLVAIWILTIVPFGIATGYMVPNMVAYHYYASPENNWDELFAGEIPRSLLVHEEAAVTDFFEGMPAGARLPGRAWLEPMVTWGVFALASYAMMLGLAVMLRRRWVEQERFTFPVVQVPLEVATSPQPGRILNAFLRHGLVWIAVVLVVLMHSLRALHNFYPVVPTFAIRSRLPFTEPPLSFAGDLHIVFVPLMIGLAYVLTSEVGFSLWFFYLLYKVQMVVMGSLGLSMAQTGYSYGGTKWASLEEAGGTIALALWFIWLGRQHFGNVFRKAFTGAPDITDADEPLTYRATVVLFLTGVGLMILWLGYFGGSWLIAVVHIAMGIAVFMVLSWAVAQGGLFYVNATFSATGVIANLTGSSWWTTRTLVVNMWNEQIFRLDLRDYLLPYLLNSFKISDSAGLNKASVVRGCAGPFLLAFCISLFTAVWQRYTCGGMLSSPNTWLPWAVRTPFRWAASAAVFPLTFGLGDVGHFVGGALVTLAMAWARTRFTWFTLHPIGFIVACGFPASALWLSVFIGWLAKSAIMRWGGYKAYRSIRPFFLGLVIGDCLAAAIWNVVGYITGKGYAVIPF